MESDYFHLLLYKYYHTRPSPVYHIVRYFHQVLVFVYVSRLYEQLFKKKSFTETKD